MKRLGEKKVPGAKTLVCADDDNEDDEASHLHPPF
jgi:hypothetical protein